jgi:hypothetical protein
MCITHHGPCRASGGLICVSVCEIEANFPFFACQPARTRYNSRRERGLSRIENAVLVDVEGTNQ